MAWNATLTVQSVSGNAVYANGTATGTDDDSTITNFSGTITYSEIPEHIVVGSVINVSADC